MKKCIIQDRHKKMGKDFECCIMCKEKIGLSYKEKLKIKVDKVSIKTKQRLLDGLHSGKTVGEAREIVGISDGAVAGEIIIQNIGNYSFLKKEAT